LEPDTNTMFKWRATIEGPAGTPYDGGYFHVELTIPELYPLHPPTAHFRTPLFHPNIHWKTGEVCLDILKQNWTPAWGLQSATQAVMALLSDPVEDSPLNCDAGNMLRAGDRRGFNSLARMYTIEHAMVWR